MKLGIHWGCVFFPFVGRDYSSKAAGESELPLGSDPSSEEEYASLSNSLKEFISIPSIDKAWTFKSNTGMTCCFCLCDFGVNLCVRFVRIILGQYIWLRYS